MIIPVDRHGLKIVFYSGRVGSRNEVPEVAETVGELVANSGSHRATEIEGFARAGVRMKDEQPTDAPTSRYQTHIAVLLVAAAVITALIGARTADLAGAAGGKWEKAIRVQAKLGAARTETERYIYGDVVPRVMLFQKHRIRAVGGVA